MRYKNININIRKLLHHPIKYRKFIKSEIEYEENKYKIYEQQNENFLKQYSFETEKVILLLVPGDIKINGGVMSICAIGKISKDIMAEKDYKVIIMTVPGEKIFYEYTEFDTEFKIFRFEQILGLTNVKEMILHIPEIYVERFLKNISKEEYNYLLKLNSLQINILNQNIECMPKPDVTEKLKDLSKNVTMTTAHKKYCTKELSEEYKMPVHMLSADYLVKLEKKEYKEKENIIIYSPDNNKYKKKILKKLQKELPDYELIEIKNMRYRDYLDLTSRAKFVITFGEGMDSYFSESILCGGIGFAVYNNEFFTDKYKDLENVYKSYEQMLENIVGDIKRINENNTYTELSKKLFDIRNKDYTLDYFVKNIKKFYKKEYTYN